MPRRDAYAADLVINFATAGGAWATSLNLWVSGVETRRRTALRRGSQPARPRQTGTPVEPFDVFLRR